MWSLFALGPCKSATGSIRDAKTFQNYPINGQQVLIQDSNQQNTCLFWPGTHL